MSVKQSKCIIHDATDFFQNVSKYHQSAVYKFVSANKFQSAREEVISINIQITPLKGTMKVHYVNGIEKGVVNTATVSCFCNLCTEGVNHYGAEGKFMKNVINGNKNMNIEHEHRTWGRGTKRGNRNYRYNKVEQPNRETKTRHNKFGPGSLKCRRSRNK